MSTTRRAFPPAPRSPAALLLTAHPEPNSFLRALAQAWQQGAEGAGMAVQHLDVHDLHFDPIRSGGYDDEPELEPDLQRFQQAVARAAHVVVAFPLWWSSTPAALKGLFDRVLLPGWAFSYDAKSSMPKPGLAGRSARVIVTMDAPGWWDALSNRSSGRRQVVDGTLKFCGLRPVKASTFGQIGKTTPAKREQMLQRARRLGQRDATHTQRRFVRSSREKLLASPST